MRAGPELTWTSPGDPYWEAERDPDDTLANRGLGSGHGHDDRDIGDFYEWYGGYESLEDIDECDESDATESSEEYTASESEEAGESTGSEFGSDIDDDDEEDGRNSDSEIIRSEFDDKEDDDQDGKVHENKAGDIEELLDSLAGLHITNTAEDIHVPDPNRHEENCEEHPIAISKDVKIRAASCAENSKDYIKCILAAQGRASEDDDVRSLDPKEKVRL